MTSHGQGHRVAKVCRPHNTIFFLSVCFPIPHRHPKLLEKQLEQAFPLVLLSAEEPGAFKALWEAGIFRTREAAVEKPASSEAAAYSHPPKACWDTMEAVEKAESSGSVSLAPTTQDCLIA